VPAGRAETLCARRRRGHVPRAELPVLFREGPVVAVWIVDGDVALAPELELNLGIDRRSLRTDPIVVGVHVGVAHDDVEKVKTAGFAPQTQQFSP